MPAQDPNDPKLREFLRGSSVRLAALIRSRGADIPSDAIEQFALVASEHMAANPQDKTFHNISATTLKRIVDEVETKLPGGRNNPGFGDACATKLRQLLRAQGGAE